MEHDPFSRIGRKDEREAFLFEPLHAKEMEEILFRGYILT